jgi:2-polyprenyl-6-methoxyphenol hydroxylase-like FAD-dependent oxidoreductase
MVGAGLGGVSLALVLLKSLPKPLPLTVFLFERDKAKEARHQGQVIRLQQEAIDVLVRELKCDRDV